METVTVRNDDGSFDIAQRAQVGSKAASEDLQRLYWQAVRASTLGAVSFSRGALRVLGVWPRLVAFGPSDGERRPIVGGLIARKPYGSVLWRPAAEETTVAVERFTPRLRGPLFRLERRFHDRVGRRFFRRLAETAA